MASICLERVSHRYPGAAQDTLSDLSLEVAAGEAHALLGGSGAGKTTLLNLLSGLERPSAGRILVDARDVSRLPPRERGVAQVFQFPVLYESLSVRANLEFPLRTQRAPRASRGQRIAAVAERLGIEHLLQRKPAALSLFQKQLVAIGRALIRPDVSMVLLDEPLTAVEPAIKWQLRRVLKAAQAELGATMIYVTHDQTEALTFAERISVLRDGRILQTGTPQELAERPAHEHVAHFVGSPGMNLLPGEVADGHFVVAGWRLGPARGIHPGACTVGFRPEWGRAMAPAEQPQGLPATVTGVRVLGVKGGQPVGIVSVDVGGRQVDLRQAVNVARGDAVVLSVAPERVLGFRDGWCLGKAAAAALEEVHR